MLKETIVVLLKHFWVLPNEVIEHRVVCIMVGQRHQHILDHLDTKTGRFFTLLAFMLINFYVIMVFINFLLYM